MGEDNRVFFPQDALEEIYHDIEMIRAIETLEWNNKNFLHHSVNRLSTEKILLCDKMLKTINAILSVRKSIV